MENHRIYTMAFAKVYPLYVAKVERKGRAGEEVDTVITWLTGYDKTAIDKAVADQIDFETFFAHAPAMNPARDQIKGVICGVRVEERSGSDTNLRRPAV